MTEAHLQRLELKSFRCFESAHFDFDGPLILIQGLNGSGKTSLLEALHYLCYLRSFRTHTPRDLVKFGAEGFFIKALFNDQEIKIGCNKNKRHIKVNQKAISSYQELRQFYRVVTVTEDDLGIVKGGPDKRRSFLDHALLLHQPALLAKFKAFRSVLDNRNALLNQAFPNPEELEIWTKKLWEQSRIIQEHRKDYLKQLQATSDQYLASQWGNQYTIEFGYSAKKQGEFQTWDEFFTFWKTKVQADEHRYKRSVFGAHLDDMPILFGKKPARLYSSRGQQKLIVLLIKIAQVKQLIQEQGSTCFLLDDFITDLDDTVMSKIISACIKLNTQLIFTTPTSTGADSARLKELGAQFLNLSI